MNENNNKKIDKKVIQNDLDKLLSQVYKKLKKKMFYRKHRKLLIKDVQIEIGELDELTAGRYETIKEDPIRPTKFHHKITISRYIYYEFKNGYLGLGIAKRCTRKVIKNTIAHELIHAYIYEAFELFSYGYGFHNDGSPIFLSTLAFLNIRSGHMAMRSFKYSPIYMKIKDYKDYSSLERYLTHLSVEYETIFNNLKTMKVHEKLCVNKFKFSTGSTAGVYGLDTYTTKIDALICKVNDFSIGANVDLNIDNLKKLVASKIDRNIFKEKYVMSAGDKLEDKKNEYKLHSMDI